MKTNKKYLISSIVACLALGFGGIVNVLGANSEGESCAMSVYQINLELNALKNKLKNFDGGNCSLNFLKMINEIKENIDNILMSSESQLSASESSELLNKTAQELMEQQTNYDYRRQF